MLHSVALWRIASGRPPFRSGRQAPAPCASWPSRTLRDYESVTHLDYPIAYGPKSMPPAYAAPEIRPLAPDHSGDSASDVSLDPPSGCRARANGHYRRLRRQRRFACFTFRLSGVSKWPWPQPPPGTRSPVAYPARRINTLTGRTRIQLAMGRRAPERHAIHWEVRFSLTLLMSAAAVTVSSRPGADNAHVRCRVLKSGGSRSARVLAILQSRVTCSGRIIRGQAGGTETSSAGRTRIWP